MTVVTGMPPTAGQRLLIDASASLAPDKTLANLDSIARLILGSVVLVTSVLTGFGLFSDVAARFREQPQALEVPVILAILSALAALLALVPWIGRVKVDDLESLRKLFTGLVVIRSILVIGGLILLLAAVLAAGVGVRHYLAEAGPSHPALTLATTTGADGTAITATAKELGAPTGSLAKLIVTAGASGATIGQVAMVVGSEGVVDLEAAASKVADPAGAKAEFSLSVNGTVIMQSNTSLGG
jgi:hypothetical protein